MIRCIHNSYTNNLKALFSTSNFTVPVIDLYLTVGLDDSMYSLLATENSAHSDLIYFDNLADSRTALTKKTLLSMQWEYSNVDFSYF